MEFVTKNTKELTNDELLQIVSLFKEVFERDTSVESYKHTYTANYMGCSFHTLVLLNNEIVGTNTMVPIEYKVNGTIFPFVNSGGTMISKRCRGIENFYDMVKESYRYAESHGFVACTGFPNDVSYPLFKGTKLMKDIGRMNTYILPYRIGGVKKQLAALNPFSQLFCKGFVFFSSILSSPKAVKFNIEKNDSSFNPYRYDRINAEYNTIEMRDGKAFYRVTVFDGVRTAFLVDITNKTSYNFNMAVKEILKREKRNIDVVLYVGHLPFNNTGMIKTPRKYEPKNFNFTGQIFDTQKIIKKEFFDIENWDVNLSNYDLI